MSRLSTGINPFRPGAGAKPPLLAGRDRELAVAERKLDELTSGQTPSQGILFWGPRGNGKTALLDRIAAMAREQGMRAERLPVPALTSDDRLVRDLQERVGLHDSRVTGVQIAGTGATSRPADPTGSVPALLRAWITAVGSPLVILVDEAHTVAPDAGMSLFDAVQQAGATTPPFLLVVAGTPGVRARLRNAGTFTERQFERMPIGRLDPEATREGLMQPARDSGHPFSREALALLAAASQDYPGERRLGRCARGRRVGDLRRLSAPRGRQLPAPDRHLLRRPIRRGATARDSRCAAALGVLDQGGGWRTPRGRSGGRARGRGPAMRGSVRVRPTVESSRGPRHPVGDP